MPRGSFGPSLERSSAFGMAPDATGGPSSSAIVARPPSSVKDAMDGPEDVDLDEVSEVMDRKLRTAVGTGNELVDLANSELGDKEIRRLSQLISEAEAGALM